MTSLTTAVPGAHRQEQGARAESRVDARSTTTGGTTRPLRPPLPALDLTAAVLVVLVLGVVTQGAPEPRLAVGTLLAWCLALAASGGWTAPDRSAGIRAVLRAGIVLGLAFWTLGAALAPQQEPTGQIALTAGLVLATAAARLTVGTDPLPVAVTGDLADLGDLMAELRRERRSRWDVTAMCVAPNDPAALSDALAPEWCAAPVWVGADAVVDAARATAARAVIVLPGRSLDPAAVRRTCWLAHEAGLEVLVGTGLLDVAPHRVRHVPAGALGLARVRPATGRRVALAAKHAADRVLAGAALLALVPVLLGIALAIRWDSPGGVLYAQRRTGRTGAAFTMYKFRTMHADADRLVATLAPRNDCDGVLFKLREDPRITRVGRVLRRYSLDELPQLINVLRGEMSLVGPRPALPAEVARYDVDPRRRLAVLPGLTGLWQVSGRSDLSWEESVRLDLHYVDNWSWALDLRILARTIGAVLSHRGAY